MRRRICLQPVYLMLGIHYLNLPSTGACTATCPTGYWADSSNHECMQCYIDTSAPDYSCYTCAVGSLQSVYVMLGILPYLNLPSTGACTATCPTGYWADSANHECIQCYINTSGPDYSCYHMRRRICLQPVYLMLGILHT